MNKVLCGANSYEEKYYFNEEFNNIPEEVKNELKIACVLYTEEVGGIITMEFSDEGDVLVNTASSDSDYLYDEIDAELQIRRMLKEKEDLFNQLETYYKVMVLHENIDIKEIEEAKKLEDK